MAALLRAARSSSLAACRATINTLSSHPQRFILAAGGFSKGFASQSPPQTARKSPFCSNMLRILHNQIDYLSTYAPPQPHVTVFNEFTVQDHPGEEWITLKRKFQDDEDIKIEVTMFDGLVPVSKSGDGTSGDMQLHTSFLVDIWKKEDGPDSLEFVCSAWPDRLEVQNVYIFRRGGLQPSPFPYMGPNIKEMDKELQDGLYEFLKRRGVDDELSVFLHSYMINKGRTELLLWLRRIKSFIGE